MKEYIVKDWAGVKDTAKDQPGIEVISEEDIFRVISNAKDNDLKISVHEIGDCVLDWS